MLQLSITNSIDLSPTVKPKSFKEKKSSNFSKETNIKAPCHMLSIKAE